jgi:hypothetical protein
MATLSVWGGEFRVRFSVPRLKEKLTIKERGKNGSDFVDSRSYRS